MKPSLETTYYVSQKYIIAMYCRNVSNIMQTRSIIIVTFCNVDIDKMAYKGTVAVLPTLFNNKIITSITFYFL